MNYKTAFFILLLICATGCSTLTVTNGQQNYDSHACHDLPLQVLLDATDLNLLFNNIAAELCANDCPTCSQESNINDNRQFLAGGQTVMVTDYADIQSFLPYQPGIVMGEMMRGSLINVCTYKIIQAEFAKYFKLSENGLIALTRKSKEVMDDVYGQTEAVIGTYSYLRNDKLIIFTRRINIQNNKIAHMTTKEINYKCAGNTVISYNVK